MMFKYSTLIDCLLRSQDPLVRKMVASLCQNTPEDDSTDIDSVQSDVPDVEEDEIMQQINDAHLLESSVPDDGGQYDTGGGIRTNRRSDGGRDARCT